MEKSKNYAKAVRTMTQAIKDREVGRISHSEYIDIKRGTYQTVPIHEWNDLTAESTAKSINL